MTFSQRAVADCPFCVAQEYATEFLLAELPALIRWRAGPLRAVVPGRAWVAARLDLTERGAPHDELLLRWRPLLPVLPELEIIVRFRIAWLKTALTLEVRSLHAAGGVRAACAAMFDRVARAALADLLPRLSGYLEQRERDYRRANPPVLGLAHAPSFAMAP